MELYLPVAKLNTATRNNAWFNAMGKKMHAFPMQSIIQTKWG